MVNTNAEPCSASAVGLYHWLDKFQFQDVTIFTSNPLEHHCRYSIEMFLPFKFFSITEPIEHSLHDWNRKYIFGALYAREKWHRLGLFSHLFANHKKISAVSLIADPKNVDSRQLFELNQLWLHHEPSFNNFAKVHRYLPLKNKLLDTYAPMAQLPGHSLTSSLVRQSKHAYTDFLIDVVAETFISGDTFSATEKTVRPMLLKKPFILMGAKDSLEYLRQMGFRTFSDFWDESYDGYEGAERYTRILDLIDTIAGIDVSRLESMYWDMKYSIDHNYDLLVNQTFSTNIDKIT